MPVREGAEQRAMRLASERREAKRQRMDEAEGAAVTDADAALMHDDGGSAVAGASMASGGHVAYMCTAPRACCPARTALARRRCCGGSSSGSPTPPWAVFGFEFGFANPAQGGRSVRVRVRQPRGRRRVR